MTARGGIQTGPELVVSATGTLRTALLTRPSPAIERASSLAGEPGPIYARVLEQQAILQSTLEYFGVETIVIDPGGDDAYEAAAGDAAIVFADGGVIMRPTAMSRRAEADRVSAKFADLDVPIAGHISAPGLLDGNDVILAGETAFVGKGTRGNDLGREGFAKLASARGYRVVEVALAPGVTSLRSVASAIAKNTIVVGGDKADAAAFGGFRTIVLDRGEELGAGVLCLDERHVLADIRYRTASAKMRRAGVTVEAIDLYDFTKIGLTPSMLTLVLKRE
jgi:dimethylargininase